MCLFCSSRLFVPPLPRLPLVSDSKDLAHLTCLLFSFPGVTLFVAASVCPEDDSVGLMFTREQRSPEILEFLNHKRRSSEAFDFLLSGVILVTLSVGPGFNEDSSASLSVCLFLWRP